MNDKDISPDPNIKEPEDWEWELADEELAPVPRKKGHLFKIITVLLILGFIAIAFPEIKLILSGQLDLISGSQMLTADEIVQKAKPAVVSIEASILNGPFLSVNQGTGFNISPQGKIITNRHVVEGSAKIKISFDSGRVFYADSYTAVKGADLAIIDLAGYNLPAIQVENNGIPQSGDQVTIIGNPLGLEKIAQRGKVGQYHLTTSNEIQVFDINVPANPGNSGSPVLNDRARAVGIVFASSQIETNGNTEPCALAIPIQAAK